MSKFSLERTINANRDTVYEILSNYENYQKLVPQHFPSVRVRSVRENISVVEEHMNLGDKELLIMAKHVTKPPVLHEVFIIGGDAKGSYIKEQLIEVSEGTRIIVDVDLKLKGKMKMSSIFRKNKFEEEYTKILDDFVKIAEN
ncbi:MAG TPA: SRPBCC family protein [Nitrosopumilus sp.]|nr:SRPBCC family protein [Thermoproteota archaeon]HJJ22666.1 SRPBCC family protein [Nitrosopumilus sp.]